MPHVHVTKCKMDSGRKSSYYTTILTGKEDCCQCTCSLSRAKHFVTSLSQWCMQESLFASVSIRSCSDLCILRRNAKWLLALVRKEFANCFPVLPLQRLLSFFCNSKGQLLSGFLSTIYFTFSYMRYWCQLHKVYYSLPQVCHCCFKVMEYFREGDSICVGYPSLCRQIHDSRSEIRERRHNRM